MTLINDILDMSKISEGKMKIVHEPFQLETVVESVSSIVYPQASDKGLVFTVPLADLTDTCDSLFCRKSCTGGGTGCNQVWNQVIDLSS